MQKRGTKIKFKHRSPEDACFRAKKAEKAGAKLQIVFKPKAKT